MPTNYLQAMAGRLGRGMGGDPRRRFAQQLMEQGVDTSPAHLGTGIGRLGKALAAAYMMRQSQGQEADAMKWLTAQQPERFRQPTEAEAFKASPDLRELEIASDVQWGSGQDQVHPDGVEKDFFEGGGLAETTNWEGGLRHGENIEYNEDGSVKKTVVWDRGKEISRTGDKGKSPPDTDLQFDKDFPPEVSSDPEPEEVPQETSFPYGRRDYAQELASGMTAYQSDKENQISDPRTRMEWLRESARGMEGNPFVSRMLQNLMFAEIARGDEEKLYQRGLSERKTAADLAWERSQQPMTQEQFEQKKELKKVGSKPIRPRTVNTAEGVYILNDDNTLGARLGSPHSQFGYPDQTGGPVTQKGKTQELQPTKDQGGIPIHESRPWDRLPIRNQGAMQQEVHKTSRGMLEKNRQFLSKQRTMRDSLQRFKYLNSLQPTGSIADRITEFSFDEEKREMVKIQNLLTPQMRQGLPGAASDRDVAMFRGATVGIDATKEINDNIIAGALARVDNAEDRQSFMEEYFQANQHLDGAETYWKEYLEANPIFDHRPELVGSYTLNANRKSYREFFGGGDANAGLSTLSPENKTGDRRGRSNEARVPPGWDLEDWKFLTDAEKKEAWGERP